MKRTLSRTAFVAAALLALFLQSFATVQSLVMEATMPPSGDMMSMCGDHGDMAMAKSVTIVVEIAGQPTATPDHHHPPSPTNNSKAVCPFCAAASHAPIVGHAATPRQVVEFAYVGYRITASQGPRAPPLRRFRARDPPTDPLTI